MLTLLTLIYINLEEGRKEKELSMHQGSFQNAVNTLSQ